MAMARWAQTAAGGGGNDGMRGRVFAMAADIRCDLLAAAQRATHSLAGAPAFRKDVTPFNRTPGGLMEQINASLQRGREG